jgi:hypothetical protein
MRIFAIAVFIATALAQESTPTQQPADDKGWGGLKWGMTLQDAREVMPECKQAASPSKDYGMLIRLEAKRVRLGQLTADASIEFYPDKDYLSAVSLKVDDSVSRSSAFESLKQGLIEKYGKPANEDQSSELNTHGDRSVTKTILWNLKSSTIRLTWFDYGSSGYVGVRYSERKIDKTI